MIDSADYELRVLWPNDAPDYGWRAISDDRLENHENTTVNIEKSEITFQGVAAVPVRLFLQDGEQEDVRRRKYVGTWGQKTDQAKKELKRRNIKPTLAAVCDEFEASGERPNRETIRKILANQ